MTDINLIELSGLELSICLFLTYCLSLFSSVSKDENLASLFLYKKSAERIIDFRMWTAVKRYGLSPAFKFLKVYSYSPNFGKGNRRDSNGRNQHRYSQCNDSLVLLCFSSIYGIYWWSSAGMSRSYF